MSPRRGLVPRAVVVLISAFALLSACGRSEDKGKTPTGARASCSADTDCVVTDRSGCCKACPDAPHAIPKLSFEQQNDRCAAVDCAAPSDRIECPKVDAKEGFVAKCKDGTCSAVRR